MPSHSTALPLPTPVSVIQGEGRAPEALPDLVQRARAADMDAFEVLYRQHSPRIYALCLRLTGGDAEAARALLQDAFVNAWRALPGFRGDAPFGTWLYRLTINAMLQNARADRRREARVIAVEDIDRSGGDSPGGGTEMRMDLERAIAELPDGARIAFVLHHIEGYQHQEIAAQLGLAVGTVKAQVHRARQLLMRSLGR